MKKLKPMSPAQARTLDEVCSLTRDNWSYGDYWIMAGGDEVTLAAQKKGEAATGIVSIPSAHFKRLIEWYLRPQERTRS